MYLPRGADGYIADGLQNPAIKPKATLTKPRPHVMAQKNPHAGLEESKSPPHIFSITVAVRRAALGFKGAARSAPVIFKESLQKRREESVLCAKTFFCLAVTSGISDSKT
jgi:hypothetical protein